MSDPKILWLEPRKPRRPSYAGQVARRRYSVQVVNDQRAACRFATAQQPAVCVVDMAPASAVERVCTALRKAAPKMRIIVVQARAGVELQAGCAEVRYGINYNVDGEMPLAQTRRTIEQGRESLSLERVSAGRYTMGSVPSTHFASQGDSDKELPAW